MQGRTGLPEAWMRRETPGNGLHRPSHFRRLVAIFFAALVAPYDKTVIDSGTGRKIVSYSQGDLMPKENIASEMKPIVLAEHDPAVIAIFRHGPSPQPTIEAPNESLAQSGEYLLIDSMKTPTVAPETGFFSPM
jgi:hypothetical protein